MRDDGVRLADEAPFALGRARFDPPTRQMTVDGVSRTVEPRVMQVLVVLARANGAVVGRDELIARCWDGRFVGDAAINRVISIIRQFAAASGFAVETVTKVGYRLLPGDDDGRRPIVAVLAFDAASAQADALYFADGLSEEVLLTVGRMAGIRVIARTSSFQFRGLDKDIARIAQDLRVSHIVNGAVRQNGNRLTVSVELIETASSTALWGERYDWDTDAPSAQHSDIARSIAEALEVSFVATRPRQPVDSAAYQLFVQGRDLIGPSETARECIALLEKSVRIDPSFAAAWSALAYARSVATRWHRRERPFEEMAGEVREAARRALQLDPNSGSAHLALGFMESPCRYRCYEIHLERAEAVAPEDSMVLLQRALFEYTVGRIRTAFRFVAKALQIDPLNMLVVMHHANLLADVGFDDESADAFILADKRWSGQWGLLGVPWLRAAMRGDWQIVDRIAPIATAANLPAYALPAFAEKMLRNPDAAARAWVVAQSERQIAARGSVETATLAFAYSMGMDGEVFDWVRRSDYSSLFRPDGHAPDGHGMLMGTIFSSASTGLQRDPRFPDLCRKIGLGDYWLETGKWPDCADGPALDYDFQAAFA